MHLQWLVSLALLLVQHVQSELTPIKIGLEWFLNPDHLPLVVALKEGYFRDAGLDVTLVEPARHVGGMTSGGLGWDDVDCSYCPTVNATTPPPALHQDPISEHPAPPHA